MDKWMALEILKLYNGGDLGRNVLCGSPNIAAMYENRDKLILKAQEILLKDDDNTPLVTTMTAEDMTAYAGGPFNAVDAGEEMDYSPVLDEAEVVLDEKTLGQIIREVLEEAETDGLPHIRVYRLK